MPVVRRTYNASGLGTGELWLRDGIVLHHELAFDGSEADMAGVAGRTDSPSGGAASPLRTIAVEPLRGRRDIAADLCERFTAHLRGERVAYDDVELVLEWCTPFERAALEALRAVPWGEVVSYGDLAALAGRPRAARAAGSFCAGNRFMLIVPCHRVVAARGLGGYGRSGVELKRRLLRLEGVDM